MNLEYEILKDAVNIVLEDLEGLAEEYRQRASVFTDQMAKTKFEGLADGIDGAVRVLTNVLPIEREHVETLRDVPSEASATSVAR